MSVTVAGEGVLLLSCGGYRSGSTYCYNLLGEYVEIANVGRRIGYVEPSQVPLLEQVWSFVDALGFAVGKSHNAPGTADGADRWQSLLEGTGTAVVPVCTVRDLRDVLHSFSRMFDSAPEDVLRSRRWEINVHSVRWWLAAGALRVAYEDLVAAPVKVLAELAGLAGLPETPGLARQVADAAGYGRPVASGGAEAASGAVGPGADSRTLLHPGHLADPAGGGWRRWGTQRLEQMRPELEPLLEEFGYAW
jgi:hypothetical protein